MKRVTCARTNPFFKKPQSLSMQKMSLIASNATVTATMTSGKPTIPLPGRQPLIERKLTDPSSASPKGEHYPIPSFFEYRIKPREFDPL
jgi:hypothetical protein